MSEPSPFTVATVVWSYQDSPDLFVTVNQALLAARGAVPSMSARGECYDNAVADACFATPEHELLADVTLLSHSAARPAIFAFIIWYDGNQRHSRLDCMSPVAYEQHLTAHPARAA